MRWGRPTEMRSIAVIWTGLDDDTRKTGNSCADEDFSVGDGCSWPSHVIFKKRYILFALFSFSFYFVCRDKKRC